MIATYDMPIFLNRHATWGSSVKGPLNDKRSSHCAGVRAHSHSVLCEIKRCGRSTVFKKETTETAALLFRAFTLTF